MVDRTARGEQITITREGTAVAELRALPHPPLSAATLLERRRRLPALDPGSLRRDVDELLHPSL